MNDAIIVKLRAIIYQVGTGGYIESSEMKLLTRTKGKRLRRKEEQRRNGGMDQGMDLDERGARRTNTI